MENIFLEKAIDIIKTTDSVFAYVSEEETLRSCAKGIGFAAMLCNEKKDLSQGAVADKVVGKAAALLFVYLGVKVVYAETLSMGAKAVFEKYGINYSYANLTEYIINRKGDGLCPMELAVRNVDTPEMALVEVTKTLEELRKKA